MKLEEKDWTIPLIYLSVGIIWIGFSDELLFSFAKEFKLDSSAINTISQWKGFFYVIVTTLFLYYLIKRKTKSLQLVKNDFMRLFEDNPNPMYIYDTTTNNILLANVSASHQYGYSTHELSKLNLSDLRPESDREKLDKYLKNLTKEFADSGEWLQKDKFGNYFYVNIFSHKTIYKGKACRIVNAINVNKKILAEIEHENFKKALNKAALVSITGMDGRIEEVNKAFCRLSGYFSNELVGQRFEILESGYHSSQFWKDMWATINLGELWRADVKSHDKSGRTYWLDMVISPIKNHEGQIYKFMSISYDITDKKELEINQQKLLDDFTDYAFQTSHELRGPLTSIMGLTSLFEKHDNRAFVVEKLKETAEQMDVVIKKMNDSLSRTALDLILKKRDH